MADEQNQPAGTPASAPAAAPAAGQPAENPRTFQLTVNGQQVTMTEQEVLAKASEAAGAQRRFQEASDLRRQAEQGIRMMELAGRIKEGKQNQQDMAEFVTLMGGDPAQLEGMSQEPAAPAGQVGKQTPEAARRPIGLSDLDPQLQQALKGAENVSVNETRKNIENTIQDVLDKDPVIRKMRDVLDADDEKKGQFQSAVMDMALESVRGEVFSGRLFDTSMAQEIAMRLRSRLKNMGFSETAVDRGIPVSGPNPQTGTFQFGMTLPSKPVERVSSSDPKYIENVTQRMLLKQAAALRAQGLSR